MFKLTNSDSAFKLLHHSKRPALGSTDFQQNSCGHRFKGHFHINPPGFSPDQTIELGVLKITSQIRFHIGELDHERVFRNALMAVFFVNHR